MTGLHQRHCPECGEYHYPDGPYCPACKRLLPGAPVKEAARLDRWERMFLALERVWAWTQKRRWVR